MSRTVSISPPSADKRITGRLIGLLKDKIATGAISPGSKLPPERELAKEFGVNRASVRQVLKVLEIMGVLSQRVGDGTYLCTSAETLLNEPLDFLVLLDDLSQHELFETRHVLEPELAARAAERATAEDLSALRNAIFALERSKTTRDRLNADLAFHDAVFRASGNRICHLLFKSIHRTMLMSMARISERVSLDHPLAFHRKIYAAIRARNADEARDAMREHITEVRNLLMQSGRS